MGRLPAICAAAAIIAGAFLAPFAAAQEAAEEAAKESPLKTQQEKISYALGMMIGQNFKEQGIEVNMDLFTRGINDTVKGGEMLMSERDVMMTMMIWQQEMAEKQRKAQMETAEKNLKAGQEFMVNYAKREGVVVRESGLQYRVITKGEGALPAADDTVKIHYAGRLIDGKEFDSSYKRGEPAVFQVGGVIEGMSEALMNMNVGSKWEIVIPPDMGYGEYGAGEVIGPQAVLIFEVELLSIEKNDAEGAKPDAE